MVGNPKTPETKGIKRRKPEADIKDRYFRVRVNEAQEAEINQAARYAGISSSAWGLERLLRCAREEAASRRVGESRKG